MRQIIILIAFILFAAPAFSGYGNSQYNIFYLAEESDVVLDVEVKDLTVKTVKGDLENETYTVLRLKGHYIGSNGLEKIRGQYYLRLSGDLTSVFSDPSRMILFIKGNGEVSNPLLGRYGMYFISDDGYVSNINLNPIIGIAEDGIPEYEKGYNSCSLDDAPHMAGGEFNANGDQMIEYTREELLNSFECPDGSQWWRGADRPFNYVSPLPISVDMFSSRIVEHLAKSNLPPPDKTKNLIHPKHVTLNQFSNLKGYEIADNALIALMDDEEVIDIIPENTLVQFYERQLLRGRSNQIPEKALIRAKKLLKNPKEKTR